MPASEPIVPRLRSRAALTPCADGRCGSRAVWRPLRCAAVLITAIAALPSQIACWSLPVMSSVNPGTPWLMLPAFRWPALSAERSLVLLWQGASFAAMSKRSAAKCSREAPPNPYAGVCASCTLDRSCAACLKTARCADCTAVARCGSCRNAHSKAHRNAGRQASARGGRAPSVCAAPRALCPPPIDAIDLPRTRDGLGRLHHLVASITPDLWCAPGCPARWNLPTAAAHTRLAVARTRSLSHSRVIALATLGLRTQEQWRRPVDVHAPRCLSRC